MRALKKRMLQWLVIRLAPAIREYEHRNLLASFGKCGARVTLYQPLVVELAENIEIGDDVSISAFVHMWGNGGIKIGDRTMIASHCAIVSGTHDPNSPTMFTSLIKRPVEIHNDVWIGSHAIVFPGVIVGEHAVIGAGAIVRDDVRPYSIVAGVPAKLVRMKEMIS